LLKIKAQPQFDRPVDRAVEAFFCVFQRSNQAQFQPDFSVFTVRSAEGRNYEGARRKFAALQLVIVSDWRSREPNDLDQAKPHPIG
jgi:hypothetical protein